MDIQEQRNINTGIMLGHLSNEIPTHRDTEEALIKKIKHRPKFIERITNPSVRVQIAAVQANAGVIRNINNPADEAIELGLKLNPVALAGNTTVSEKVVLEAIETNGYAISSVNKPTEEMQIVAVSQCGNYIRFIENPTEVVQHLAIDYDETAFRFIRRPCESIVLRVAKIDPWIIVHRMNRGESSLMLSESVLIKMVQADPDILSRVDNIASEKVQMAAVEVDGLAVRYLFNPSEKVQLAAVKQNKEAMGHLNEDKLPDKLKLMVL